MSYSTWHNYGYGIRVDDIKEQNLSLIHICRLWTLSI